MAPISAEAPATHIAAALAADPHRPGSVDRRLLESQLWLTPGSAAALYQTPAGRGGSRPPQPWLESVARRLIADCVHDSQRASALRRWVAAVPRSYPEGGRSTRDGFWGDFRTFLCGGTEEEVVKKGSPLAAELCRVLTVLSRSVGLSARIAYLYADEPPVRHAVCEIYIAGRWSVFDPIADRTYIVPKRGYASAWEIHRSPRLLDELQDHGRVPYVAGRFYRTVGIAWYDPADQSDEFPWDPLDPSTASRLAAGEGS